MKRLSIVGTAGRTGAPVKLNHVFFMLEKSRQVLDELLLEGPVVIKSGGAAWADHTAVLLFLEDKRIEDLELHLPCHWDEKNIQFFDTGIFDWKTNPGGTSNHYHRKYSKAVWGTDWYSLHQIDAAIRTGAKTFVGNGFHNRNTEVARTDVLLAFTFFANEPTYGGTADTWNKARASGADCRHVTLT